ncbi:Phosphopantetheine attachment site [Lachnospiraceae bacterium XBD2001]|nr:Phosphopantetheine attachment site [Lachnospiraceae bacterium XBD2001]
MREQILELLQDLNPDITDDDSVNLVEDEIIDSFDIANLVAAFEDAFEIEIDGEDIVPESFYNITAMEALIEKYKN